MKRYYKTADDILLEVDRDCVNYETLECAVTVSVAFGEQLFVTEKRVTTEEPDEDEFDTDQDYDFDYLNFQTRLDWVQEDEELYRPLFEEAKRWIMKEFPGAKRSLEDEELLGS